MEAAAHEALGHIASKRGRLLEATASFEKAVEENPSPTGSQVYRLGVAYMLAGKEEAAHKTLRRAAEMGPEEIRRMARAALDRMRREKDP
jgi:Flp pilus assembly protein TadD